MQLFTNPVPDFGAFLLVMVILLLILLATFQYLRFSGVPPGPRGLPLIGMTLQLQMSKNSWHFSDLPSTYGSDIISAPMLGGLMIILNSAELCKEVYQKRLDIQDRPPMSLFKTYDEDFTGVVATNGRIWKEARRFSVTMLKDFGMGRTGAEERIQQESEILREYIKIYNNDTLDPTKYLEVAVSNVICGLVFGQRFDVSNEEFAEALDGMHEFVKEANPGIVFLLAQTEFGRDYLVKKQLRSTRTHLDQFRAFVKKQIEEHKKTYNGEVTDLIYAFLQEMENGKDPEVFNEKMLESLVVDYFFAGTETSYETLRWAILAMCLNPEIQKTMQNELDGVIGEMPTLDDRKNTPYSEAVLCEALRFYTLVPYAPPHYNQEEITIRKYRIPKHSLITPNLYWIHHDPKVWKNPNNFDPENFLEDGKLVNTEKLIPFGVGRRACAGEALARVELYLFFVSLVKNFDMRLAGGIPEDRDFVGRFTISVTARPFDVIFSAR